MSTCRTYRHAQDIDVLSIPWQGVGDGHDTNVVTILQSFGNEGFGRFAGGGKAMVWKGKGHHFAGAGKMVGQREADGPFSPLLFMTACEKAERSTGCY